jgi:orotidine-5'-phosphate decarboxylase
MSPKGAILAGADHLVVGRPILHAPDRKKAALDIQEEIRAAKSV